MGLVVNITPLPLYPQERELSPRTSGPVWTGAENLAPTWIRSLDRPARGESPNRLRYPGPPLMWNLEIVSGLNMRGMGLTSRLHLVLSLRMTGSLPTLTLCADLTSAGTN